MNDRKHQADLAPGSMVNRRKIVVSAADSPHGHMVVRGNVNADGTIAAGEGFTCFNNAAGGYTLTFTPAFKDVPTVILTVNFNVVAISAAWSAASATSVSSATITISVGGAFTNRAFGFIAMGQRG